jgi:general secretion pathway protein G
MAQAEKAETIVMCNKQSSMRRRVRAFTLLEVLMVVIIIGLLAAFVVPNFFNAGEAARVDLCKATVKAGLNGALDLYRAHVGQYPQSDKGGLKLLLEAPDDEDQAKNWHGPYVKSAQDLKDPWNHEYKYECPGKYNEKSYDLSSDGQSEDEKDDICNWEKT